MTMMAIQDAWFATLKKNEADFETIYAKRPRVEDSSIFYFHFLSAGLGHNRPLPRFYAAYAYHTHKCLTNLFADKGEESSKDAYALSARYFFTNIHDEILSTNDYPLEMPGEYINLFARQFDISTYGNYDSELSDLAKSHRGRLERLFGGQTINPHKPSAADQAEQRPKEKLKEKKETILHPELVTGTAVILNPKEQPPNFAKHIFRVTRESDDDEEAFAGRFEAPDELEIVEQEDTETIVREKPTLRKALADLINLRSFVFPWDSTQLGLYHYSLLDRKAEQLRGTTPLNDAIITYIDVLASTGMDPRQLCDLSTKEHAAGSAAPQLREHSGRSFIVIESIVRHKTEFNGSYCPKVSADVWVPLADSVAEKVSSIRTHGSDHVLSYAEDGRIKRLSLLDVEKYLTPKIISRSFLPLYHGRFNLDPLICVLASGQDYYRLYRTQLHYVYINHERFQREYLLAHETAQAAIRRNTDECLRLGFFEGTVLPDRGPIPSLNPESGDEISTPAVPDGNKDAQKLDFGYGSPIICGKDYIVGVVKKLGNAINAAADPITRHNLQTVFIYLYLEFCACLRPRNHPEIYWSDLKNTGTITICDKQSAKYNEERSIHLISIMRLHLKGFESAVAGLRLYLMSHRSPEALGRQNDRVFFFADEKSGLPVEFTLKMMKEYLNAIDVDWTLPPNFPRHYTSNYLYACGVPLEVIEYWMGHQHAGREILNITSSIDLAAIAKPVIPHIEKLVDELGFTKELETWKTP
jgi:hypothetical protein